MRENWFEKRLKSKVSKENHELDFDGVWSDIQANRSDNDRKRPFFWKWGVFGLLVLGFGLAYMLNTDQEEINNYENRTEIEETESILNNEGENTIAKSQTKNSEGQKDLSELTSEIDLVKQNVKAKISDTQSAYSALKIKSKDNQTNGLEILASNQLEESLTINRTPAEQEEFNRFEGADQEELSSLVESNSAEHFLRENQDMLTDSRTSLKRLDVLGSLKMIGFSAFNIGERKLNLEPSWEVFYSPRTSSIKKKNMLSFGFAYGLNNDVLSTNIDSAEVSKIIDRRNTVESRLDYFSSNLSYKRFISSTVFMNVGLGFEQYTSKFEYEDYTFTSGSRFDTTEIIIYENGEMSFVSGEVPFVTTSINKNINYLKYRSITLPIGLGFSTDLNESFNIELQAGITYHLRLLNKGNVLNSDVGSQDLRPLEDLYRTSNHWSSYAGFFINRYIGENWKVGFGFHANFDLTNRSLNTSGFSHKMNSYSGQIGLTRMF